eukprot:scaffold123804_cov25-Tisochrysis_lutea.AAC.1
MKKRGEPPLPRLLRRRLHHRPRQPHHPHPNSSYLGCPPLTSSANALAPAILSVHLALAVLAALVAPPIGLTASLAASHFLAAHIAAVHPCLQPCLLGAHRPSFAISQTSSLDAAARAAPTLAAALQHP